MAEAGLDAGHVHTAVPGETFEAAGFRVEVLGGEHAVIHAEVPRPVNVSYLVDGAVLHPGDSFTVPDAGVEPRLRQRPREVPWRPHVRLRAGQRPGQLLGDHVVRVAVRHGEATAAGPGPVTS